MKSTNALILVDLQNDFCPGGALAVEAGDQVIPIANKLMPLFNIIIAGCDWHPADHCSFKEQGGPWPPHCVAGTTGAEYHPALDKHQITYHLRKAFTPADDDYSEFGGCTEQGQHLDTLLKTHGVTTLYVCGLATDYCVRYTVLDALRRGYRVFVITDAIRAVNVNPGDDRKALEEMANAGARLTTSETRTDFP